MRTSPSIIPTDRLDRDIYLVLEDFRSGPAWRETHEGETDYPTLTRDLLSGQYDQPLRVVAFNPVEGWSRDASKDVAFELARRVDEGGRDISQALRGSSRATLADRSVFKWRCRCASDYIDPELVLRPTKADLPDKR